MQIFMSFFFKIPLSSASLVPPFHRGTSWVQGSTFFAHVQIYLKIIKENAARVVPLGGVAHR